MPNQKGWLTIVFISFTLAIPFAITYYISTRDLQNRYDGWQREPQATGIPSKSGQVLLLKNKRLIIGRTCVIFRGASDNVINIDLYLLDLDPDIPYPLKFTKQSVRDGIWLGNVQYRLVSLKGNILRLKIHDSYSTL